MFTIDLDIGSTCTDGFFTDGSSFRLAKVLTTPHDLAECTIDCVAAGAAQFGVSLEQFLRDAIVSRLSSTLGTNLVVQRTGIKLGLLVSRGSERNLYGTMPQAPILDLFVPSAMVLGVNEEIDDEGRICVEPEGDQVLEQVRKLVEMGARMVVVSLRNSWRNPHNERRVRAHVHERYPAQYLRSVPIQISSEVAHDSDDHTRTNSTVLNAYIHPLMARSLYRIEDHFRDCGSRRPLLVVHAHGGSGRIAKTTALHTLSSGPAVAVRGAAELCKLLGIRRALTIDMGGTSLDATLINDGIYRVERSPTVHGVHLATPMVEVESIAAGGSTIARVTAGQLTVGPQSAGVAPGPACYGRGGTEATVADANLMLGYVDADYFLGGRLKLDRVRAERAITRNIASRLKLDVIAAATAMRESVTAIMGDKLASLVRAAGGEPQDYTMFVLGGSGALHACAIADRVGISSMIAFAFSPVFSAFGASTTDIQHLYSHTLVVARETFQVHLLAQHIEELLAQAARDMEGEGFAPQQVVVSLNARVAKLGMEPIVIGRRRLSEASASRFSEDLLAKLGRIDSRGDVPLEISVLSTASAPHWNPSRAVNGRAPQHGGPHPKTERVVHWGVNDARSTPIFDNIALTSGTAVRGPAIVESPSTNYVIAPGWQFMVNEKGHYIFERCS